MRLEPPPNDGRHDDARYSDGRDANDRGVRYAVLGWLCAAAAIAYLCRQSLGVAESTIRGQLAISETQMSWILSGFFWSYALAQVPAGWLAQRHGSRAVLPLVAVGWSLATMLSAGAWGWQALLAARMANGLAQAGLFPAAVNTVARWFPRDGRALASGALGASMGVGEALTAVSTARLVGVVDWRWVFVAHGALGLVWARGFFRWFRERPEDHPEVTPAEIARVRRGAAALDDEPFNNDPPNEEPSRGDARDDAPPATPGAGAFRAGPTARGDQPASLETPPSEPAEPTPWLALLLSPAMWCVCGQQFCRAAGDIFFATWFATYLQQTRGVSVALSGVFTMLPVLARVLGGLSGGIVSDWTFARTGSLIWARKGVATASLVGCAALVFAALQIQDARGAVACVTLGAFVAAFAAPCGYAITIDVGGKHVPAVFSSMNMIGNIGAALFPLAATALRQATGSWNTVLALFGLLYLAAAAFWLLLDTRGPAAERSLWPPPARDGASA